MGMENHEAILRSEFEAGDGSFLSRLRAELIWDQAAFSRLVISMEAWAASHERDSALPRWIAEGFWFCERFTREWSSHPNFPREYPPEYHEKAWQRLSDLAYWLFRGESPYQGAGPLPPL